jgi:hypothetical protein
LFNGERRSHYEHDAIGSPARRLLMSERVFAGWSAGSTPAPARVLSHSTHLTLFNIPLTHTTSYTAIRLKKQMDIVCTVRVFIRAETRDSFRPPET